MIDLTLQTIPSPLISELLTYSSLDGVLLDTEHGHFNNETLYSCIQVITLSGKKCFVRFTDLNKQLVRMCLDAGVDGVVFSTVNDYKYAKEILEYCKYPSQKGKRGCGLVRENKWGEKKLDSHRPIIIAQIETIDAIKNISDLMPTKNIDFDYYVIGPYDISSSLLKPGEFEDKDFIDSMNLIYKYVPISKLGLFLPTKQDINRFRKQKKDRPNMLIWGMDTDFILQSLKDIENGN
jgi:4-hydroxy-2-oxoheptanedioate aldolase